MSNYVTPFDICTKGFPMAEATGIDPNFLGDYVIVDRFNGQMIEASLCVVVRKEDLPRWPDTSDEEGLATAKQNGVSLKQILLS